MGEPSSLAGRETAMANPGRVISLSVSLPIRQEISGTRPISTHAEWCQRQRRDPVTSCSFPNRVALLHTAHNAAHSPAFTHCNRKLWRMMCFCVLIETRGKVSERRWWTHLLLSEALTFCRGTLEIVSRLMDRWSGITRQTHLLPAVWPGVLEKKKKKKRH